MIILYYLSNLHMGGGGAVGPFVPIPLDPYSTVAIEPGTPGYIDLDPNSTVATGDP